MKKKKKNGACVFWAPVFFKAFWRENYAILTRWYLISFNNNKTGACVFWAPVFFLSFLAGKLKIFNRGYKGKSLHKNWQSNLAKYVEFEFDTPCWRKTKTLRKSIKRTELSTVLRKQSWRTWTPLTVIFYLCFELEFELSDLVPS